METNAKSGINWHGAEFEASAGLAGQLPVSDLPEVVFSGRSNVGKSSLINTVLHRKALARVSSTPGKTATINFYRLSGARLVDLPGYGYAKVSDSEKKRWSGLIRAYFDHQRDLRLVIQLIDSRHPPSRDDISMIDYMVDQEIPFVIVLTKMDKLNKTQRQSRISSIPAELGDLEGVKIIPFSSITREGAEELREVIEFVTESYS